jgi:hypothetical protein
MDLATLAVDGIGKLWALDMTGLRYSEFRDRLLRSSTHRLRLVARIKPSIGLLGRIRNPWRFRVERYHLEGTDESNDVAVKYALGADALIEREVHALELIKESGATEGAGLLFPEIVKVAGLWATGTALVNPWKPGGTLEDIVREGTANPVELAELLKQCSRALRRLHDVSVPPAAACALPAFPLLGPGRGALEGDPAAAALVEPVLRNIPVNRLESRLENSASWVHADCFAHQFVLDRDGAPWLLDWGGLQVSRSGLSDLAQLWASLELAVLLSANLAPHISTFWNAVQEGYERELDKDTYFRVLELQALVRFSPRTSKFGAVVPTRVAFPDRATIASSSVPSDGVLSKYESLVRRRKQELEALAQPS